MREFQCLLFVLKRSYIGYYIICMTVPLNNYFEKVLPVDFSHCLDNLHTFDKFSFTLDNYNIKF